MGQHPARYFRKNSVIGLGVLVLLFAAFLRINNAASHSMWSDEGWNLWVIQGESIETVLSRLAANHHPPAYFLSLDLWETLAGHSRIALRYLAILGGILSTAVLYRAGTDLFGKRAGITAAILFAVFEQAIYYGQAVRHYGWLALGVSLTILFIVRYLKHPTRSLLIPYTLSMIFTLYTMYLGALVVGIQAFIALFIWRGSRQAKLRLFISYAIAGLSLLPWLIYALPGQWHKVERGVIGGYHNSFATTPNAIFQMSEILLGGQFALGLGLFSLAAYQILQRRESRQFLVLACGAGIFAAMLILNIFVGILSERTLFYLVPAVVLVLGYGFQLLPTRASTVLLIGFIIWALFTPPTTVPTINSGPTARQVLEGYSSGDFVLLETGFDDVAFEYEMRQTLPADKDDVFRTYYEYDFPDDASMMQALAAQLEDEQRVWLVYWNVPPRMRDYLRSLGFRRVQHHELPTGDNDPLYTEYPFITVSLYVRPDDVSESLNFGDLLELNNWTIAPSVDRPSALQVDLWWSPLQNIDRDYSIGVFLLDENGVTQVENIGPMTPVSTWEANTLVFDRHTLPLPENLPAGEYTVIVNVYWWETVEPLLVNGQPFAELNTVTVR